MTVRAVPWLSAAGDIGNEDVGLVQQIAAVVSWEVCCEQTNRTPAMICHVTQQPMHTHTPSRVLPAAVAGNANALVFGLAGWC
jgi:hypothetical protein